MFEAEDAGDALDALSGPPVQRQGSKRWGILARRQGSLASKDSAAAAAAAAAAAGDHAHELAAARSECARQGAELQALRRELGAAQAAQVAAHEALNLQRFKFELLVDLWAMRVLDNEELGSRTDQER